MEVLETGSPQGVTQPLSASEISSSLTDSAITDIEFPIPDRSGGFFSSLGMCRVSDLFC